MEAANARAEEQSAREALDRLDSRVQTRRSALETSAVLRAERERLAFEIDEREEQRAAKEAEILEMLENPLDAFDEDAVWQLAMHEFALDCRDETLTGRQMGVRFRALAESVRHAEELPRFRGAYELDALRDAYLENERLCRELNKQLHVFKRLYCSLMSGFGRFRKVKVVPGETLIDLMYRTHKDARKWRPPGNQGHGSCCSWCARCQVDD